MAVFKVSRFCYRQPAIQISCYRHQRRMVSRKMPTLPMNIRAIYNRLEVRPFRVLQAPPLPHRLEQAAEIQPPLLPLTPIQSPIIAPAILVETVPSIILQYRQIITVVVVVVIAVIPAVIKQIVQVTIMRVRRHLQEQQVVLWAVCVQRLLLWTLNRHRKHTPPNICSTIVF